MKEREEEEEEEKEEERRRKVDEGGVEVRKVGQRGRRWRGIVVGE